MKTFYLLLCAALFAVPVSANEGPDHAQKGGDAKFAACKADIEKLCKDIEPGEGRIMDCLKAHDSELSEGCKAKGGARNHAKMAGKEVCAEDKDSFCKDVQPGDGRIIRCFKEHEKELSEGCRAFMAKEKDAMKTNRPDMTACAGDKEKFCADVKPGKGRIIECMKAHKNELSGACRDTLTKKGDRAGKNKCAEGVRSEGKGGGTR